MRNGHFMWHLMTWIIESEIKFIRKKAKYFFSNCKIISEWSILSNYFNRNFISDHWSKHNKIDLFGIHWSVIRKRRNSLEL